MDAGAQEFVPGASASVPSKDMDAGAPEFVPQGIKVLCIFCGFGHFRSQFSVRAVAQIPVGATSKYPVYVAAQNEIEETYHSLCDSGQIRRVVRLLTQKCLHFHRCLRHPAWAATNNSRPVGARWCLAFDAPPTCFCARF